MSVTELAKNARILAIVPVPCKKTGNLVYSDLLPVVLHPQLSQGETKMNRFALAIALSCVLTVTALAGEIHSTGAPEPGEIHTTGSPDPGDIPSTNNASPGDIPGVDLSIVLTITDLLF